MNKIVDIQNKNNERLLLAVLFIALFILFFLIIYFAEATFDAGDGLAHYFISRYSWKHPELLFDQWGKPLFTFLSSPFSQFGLIGMNVFQIICALATSFFCFRIAKGIGLKFAWILPILICFSPIYFCVINSGLTEPLFGCILMLSVLLFYEDKYLAGALVSSFLPFVKAEATFVLPLIALFLILKRKPLALLLLSTAFIAYSIIGFFYYQDILWIIHQNPYHTDKSTYGDVRGPLFHYVQEYDFIFGKPLSILLVVGIFFPFLYFFLRKKKKEITGNSMFFMHNIFLIHGTFWSCFTAHSILWGMGLFPTLGMLRYMTTIIPSASLISLMGFNLFIYPLRKWTILQQLSALIYCSWIITVPFRQSSFPFRPHPELPVVQTAAEWIKKSEYRNEKIYFLHPYLPFSSSIDPFDHEKACQLWGLYASIKESSINIIPEKTLIVWDAHYAANEGELSLDTLMNDTNFRLLKIFKPQEEFTVLGGYPFAVYIFSREKQLKRKLLSSELFDFEQPDISNNEKTLSQEKSFSGVASSKMKETNEYSDGIVKQLKIFPWLTEIKIKAKVFSSENLSGVFFVMQIDDSTGNNLSWEGKEIKIEQCKENEWKDFETKLIPSSDLIKPGNTMKLYFWNKPRKTFFVDDIQIIYNRIK